MVRILALALLLLAGSVSYSAPAQAAADGPILKGLFKKGGKKTLKKNKKHKKYYHVAAKKQRKAKFNSHRSMVP